MSECGKQYVVKVNEFSFQIDESELKATDILKTSPSTFHLIKNSRSVNAVLLGTDSTGKKMSIEIDGETFHVDIMDQLDQMLNKMGYNESAAKQIKEIKAPMPGLVLQIAVENGQEVNEGDRILILEAMKMENTILTHSNAVIKKIVVSPGQAVERGQVLVELE